MDNFVNIGLSSPTLICHDFSSLVACVVFFSDYVGFLASTSHIGLSHLFFFLNFKMLLDLFYTFRPLGLALEGLSFMSLLFFFFFCIFIVSFLEG